MKNKVLQFLSIDNLYSETNTLMDSNGYLLLGNPSEGLDDSSFLRKEFRSKQEAVDAPEFIKVKYKTRIAKFEKRGFYPAVIPDSSFNPQNKEEEDNVPYVAFWTIVEDK